MANSSLEGTSRSDGHLDAGGLDDDAYLAQLGYKPQLARALGLFSSFGVQFSMVAIGSSLMTTLIVGLQFFGPATWWSFLVGGACQMLVGLAVAELVSCYPLAGGCYQIVNRITRKAFLGFQSGWLMVIAHVVAVPAIAVSMTPFIASWFGWHLDGNTTKLMVIVLVLMATAVNFAGVKIAAMINNVGVVAELVGFAVVIVALLVHHHPTHSLSFLNNTGGTTKNGWLKPAAFGLILPAYIISSFDSTGNTSEETHDAARKAPRGVTVANFASLVYGLIGIALLVLAIQNLPAVLGSNQPVKLILETSIGNTITQGFIVLAMLALFAAMVMLQLTAARVLWAQARDGQLPASKVMSYVNKDKVPATAVLVTLVLSVIMTVWSSLLSVLVAFTAIAWALAYGIVIVAGIGAIRGNRLPAHPWRYGRWSLPIFGLATIWSVMLCIILVWSDWKHVGLGILAALAAGVILYFLIPPQRRGKIRGVTDRPGLEPIKAGAELTV